MYTAAPELRELWFANFITCVRVCVCVCVCVCVYAHQIREAVLDSN